MSSRFLMGLACLAWSAGAHASVVVNATRVVYDQADGEKVVQLRNTGKGPVLVQSWIDEGSRSSAMANELQASDVSFVLTPSVARIDAGKGQAIRILQTRQDLPADRESQLWLNVLEVPPAPARKIEQGDSLLQFSFRTRIKLFYRPKSLPGTAEEAPKHLRFTIERGAGGAPRLHVHNPSAYHVTFRELKLRENKNAPAAAELGRAATRMITPFGDLSLPLDLAPSQASLPPGLEVFFTIINDYGGETHLRGDIQP